MSLYSSAMLTQSLGALKGVCECGRADKCCGYTGVAFVPYAMYVLTAAPFLGALGIAVSMSFIVLVPLVVTDWLFYGRWTVGILKLCSLPSLACLRSHASNFDVRASEAECQKS